MGGSHPGGGQRGRAQRRKLSRAGIAGAPPDSHTVSYPRPSSPIYEDPRAQGGPYARNASWIVDISPRRLHVAVDACKDTHSAIAALQHHPLPLEPAPVAGIRERAPGLKAPVRPYKALQTLAACRAKRGQPARSCPSPKDQLEPWGLGIGQPDTYVFRFPGY